MAALFPFGVAVSNPVIYGWPVQPRTGTIGAAV